MLRASRFVLVLATAAALVGTAPRARADRCDGAALREAVAGLGTDGSPLFGLLRGAPRTNDAILVQVSPARIVEAVFGAVARPGCELAVVRARYTIHKEDRRGLDVFFPPEHVDHVAVVERARRRLRVVARWAGPAGAPHGVDPTRMSLEDPDRDGIADVVLWAGTRRLHVLRLAGDRLVPRTP